MHIALASMPWGEPRRRSWRRREDPIRSVRNALHRIESSGLCEAHRAELILAVRKLLSEDYWDGPLSAA